MSARRDSSAMGGIRDSNNSPQYTPCHRGQSSRTLLVLRGPNTERWSCRESREGHTAPSEPSQWSMPCEQLSVSSLP